MNKEYIANFVANIGFFFINLAGDISKDKTNGITWHKEGENYKLMRTMWGREVPLSIPRHEVYKMAKMFMADIENG